MEAKKLFVIRTKNEENNDFIITIGKHLATEKHFESKEEAENYIETPQWDTILALIGEIQEFNENRKEGNNGNN